MSDVTFAAIISGVLAGGFGIFGVWLGHRLNRKASNEAVARHEFIKAANDFREPFLNTKYSLVFGEKKELGQPFTTLDIVQKDFSVLEKAYFRFFEILPKDKRVSFEIAWIEYICEPKEGDILDKKFENCYLPYRNPETGEWIRTEEDCRQSALERIDKLLKFANT